MSLLLPALREARGNGGHRETNPAQELREQHLLQEKGSEERCPWNEGVGCTLAQTSPGFQVGKSNPGLCR